MNRLLLTVFAIGAVGAVGTAQAAGDVAAGQAKAAACALCHGQTGMGGPVPGGTTAPKLAGEDPAKFVAALQAYKSGAKDNPMMKMQSASLSDADMANLAAYYASLK